ncbi:PepSY domain-containing protein [Stenotrophomonas sp. LARHCG68]
MGAHPVQAHGRDDCEVPINQWKPRDAVREMARQKGWQIDRLKIDDGCYEIKGCDGDGRRFKAKIDPASLEIVRIKGEGDGHGKARQRESNAGGPSAETPVDDPATSGTKPQAEIR